MECLLSHLVKIGVFRNHLIADININIPSYCHATSKFFSLFFNEIFECDLEPKGSFFLNTSQGSFNYLSDSDFCQPRRCNWPGYLI